VPATKVLTKRATRTDKKIANLIGEIETHHKIPVGSVQIVRPNGRRMNDTSNVGLLLDAWEK
jgi:hypothetical protein